MTNSMDDLAHETDCYLVIGSNTTENHPIIGDHIKAAVMQRGAKVIVIDPRSIPLTKQANVFLQVPPGYNIPVLNAMMNVFFAAFWEHPRCRTARARGVRTSLDLAPERQVSGPAAAYRVGLSPRPEFRL